MMFQLLVSLGLCLFAADDPATAALADDVALLIRQLDGASLSERDAAEQKLLSMGAAVLPLLPPVGSHTPAEVTLRVTRVQQKLLDERARAAAKPALVTLSGKNLPLADVLTAIGEQTLNKVTDHREAFGEEKTPVKVNVDFEQAPFWQVLDNVLDQAELTLYPFSGERGAYVVNRAPNALPRSGSAVYAGLLRLEPLRFEAVRMLRNERTQSLKFFLEATWEPRLQPFAILQPLSEVHAVGDTGEVIAVSGGQGEPESTIREGMSAVELEIVFALPKRSTTKITSLKGKLTSLVPGALEEFHFKGLPIAARNAPTKPVEQRKAGAVVTVDQVKKNNDAWEVGIRVKFDAPTIALESHRSWILDNEAYFLDANGQKVQPGGLEQTRQTKDEVGITYFFVLDDRPDKLEFVYRTPITILEIPVAYEFRDLPLP